MALAEFISIFRATNRPGSSRDAEVYETCRKFGFAPLLQNAKEPLAPMRFAKFSGAYRLRFCRRIRAKVRKRFKQLYDAKFIGPDA
jgi:hypothetical protein